MDFWPFYALMAVLVAWFCFHSERPSRPAHWVALVLIAVFWPFFFVYAFAADAPSHRR